MFGDCLIRTNINFEPGAWPNSFQQNVHLRCCVEACKCFGDEEDHSTVPAFLHRLIMLKVEGQLTILECELGLVDTIPLLLGRQSHLSE